MRDGEVLVVGAGPTGLVLALVLARHGIRVRIVDRASGPGQASRAMAVQARTLELYGQLGFADEVVRQGIKAETVHLRAGGREVATISLKEMGEGVSPYPFMLSYPQDEHERFLAAKLAALGVEVAWGTELASFAQDEAGVRAVLVRDGVEEACGVAYLCGCDGAHSRVRHGLGLDFPGGTYEQLFYVADVKVEGAFSTDLNLTFGAQGLGLTLPIRSRGVQRWIGIAPPELAGRDDLSFEDVRPEAERLVGARVETVNWFSTYRVHHRVASRFRVGRCFIAGDAGHIHSPAGGQGMNTGIGDAANLAWKVAHVLKGRADASILDTYEPERIAFARRLVATTDAVFSLAVTEGGRGRVLRSILLPRLAPLLAGFAAFRRLVFRTVSQVRIAYRSSALSEGRAGDIWGGDRLPWLGPAAGDNFAPLRSLDWQLHVVGEARSDIAAAAERLGLAMHVVPWSEAADAAGLGRDAAYLVRPDGYVALALPRQEAEGLTRFVDRWRLGFVERSAQSSMVIGVGCQP